LFRCFGHIGFLFEDPPRRIPLFPFSAPIFLSSNFNPAIARRIFSGEGVQGARQRYGLSITAEISLSCPLRAGKNS
jgi:hypothetical protein